MWDLMLSRAWCTSTCGISLSAPRSHLAEHELNENLQSNMSVVVVMVMVVAVVVVVVVEIVVVVFGVVVFGVVVVVVVVGTSLCVVVRPRYGAAPGRPGRGPHTRSEM